MSRRKLCGLLGGTAAAAFLPGTGYAQDPGVGRGPTPTSSRFPLPPRRFFDDVQTEALFNGPVPAQGFEVDNVLVIGMDVSPSVDGTEYRMQRDGTAVAIASDGVKERILNGILGRSLVCLVEFAGQPDMRIGWTLLDSEEAVDNFAATIMGLGRSPRAGIGTDVYHMINMGTELVERAVEVVVPMQAVMDISGDGPESFFVARGNPEYTAAVSNYNYAAREHAWNLPINQFRNGITINGLAIHDDRHDVPDFYRNWVVTPNGRVWEVANHEDFARVMEQKLTNEFVFQAPSGQQMAPRVMPT